jgi:hypothetical protein
VALHLPADRDVAQGPPHAPAEGQACFHGASRAAAKPARTAVPPPKPSAAVRSTDKPARSVVPNANLTRPREAALDSAQIAADVAAFEARGGRIERFQPGESSQSIRAQHEAYLASRGRGAAKQQAAARTAVKRTNADNDDTFDADNQADVA